MTSGNYRGNGHGGIREGMREGMREGRGEMEMREGPFEGRREDRFFAREPRERMGARRWRRGTARARDIMTRNVKAARPTDPVTHVAQIMVDEDCGIVPICEDNGRLLGVITDRDIVCRLIARGVDMREARARDVMTDEVECVTEDETLSSVLRLMSEHQVRRIPVVARGDRLLGIIAMADLAREADVDEELQDTFEDISSERSFWSRLR
jgi:CBS domain-containing protein